MCGDESRSGEFFYPGIVVENRNRLGKKRQRMALRFIKSCDKARVWQLNIDENEGSR
jgi:hypothetical protein